MKWFFTALTGFAILPATQAPAILIQWDVDQSIPDNDPNGFVSVQTISVPFDSIGELRVTLETEGGWAGDLYAYLQHDSGFSVLLNRPGLTSLNAAGFAGSYTITLADNAGVDIHLASPGSSGNLTGLYQPDGRETDPSSVLDTDSRTAMLSGFTGANPNGEWALYMADVSAGDQTRLVRWGLDITPASVPVPESGSTLPALAAATGGLALWRRLRKEKHVS
jgi:subtilisin-like proprotein convertase family protein